MGLTKQEFLTKFLQGFKSAGPTTLNNKVSVWVIKKGDKVKVHSDTAAIPIEVGAKKIAVWDGEDVEHYPISTPEEITKKVTELIKDWKFTTGKINGVITYTETVTGNGETNTSITIHEADAADVRSLWVMMVKQENRNKLRKSRSRLQAGPEEIVESLK